jgi:NAD(P)-dependent dehydrogenase (short-subunit alcohol dehydrogenase family)
MRLESKIALITGGNSGISLATTRLFLAEGARVAITGWNRKTLDAAVAELASDLVAIQEDVTNVEAIERAVAVVVERIAELDIAFTNAGVAGTTTVGKTSPSGFEDIVRTNPTSVFFTVQVAACTSF